MEEKITAIVKDEAYIARSEAGYLTLYVGDCPLKTDCAWEVVHQDGTFIKKLDEHLFPEVKWEDKEPTEVELTIKIR